MVDAGGVTLADLGGVEGFDKSGEKDQLYALQLPDGVYKRKKFAPPPLVAKIRRYLASRPTAAS